MAKKIDENEKLNGFIDAEFDDVSESELDKSDELALILKEIGEAADSVEYAMKVYRREKNGNLAWLYDCHPTEPQFAYLRDQYDGGNFQFRIYRDSVLFKSPKIKIEVPVGLKKSSRPGAVSEPTNFSQTDIIRLIEESQKNTIELISKMMTPAQPVATVNPITQLAEMMTLMGQMREFNKKETVEKIEQPDIFDQMEKMQKLKKLFGSNDGESSTADILISAIEHIGAPLSELTKQSQQAQQKKLAGKTDAPQQIKLKRNTKKMNELKMGIGMLVGAAKRNADPAPYVDIILEKLDEAEIKKFLVGDNAIQALSEINKDVLTYPAWFVELKKVIEHQLNENADEQDSVAEK